MNSADRFRRVCDLFEATRALASPQREALLEEMREHEPSIATEVERLLRNHDRAQDTLDQPLVSASSFQNATDRLRANDEPLPQQIGPYQVLRKLGEGGMGVVFLAQQDQPRRDVAVKVIRSGFVTREALKRFEFEVAVLGRLRHPGIAQVYDAGLYEEGGEQRPFFAMELVEGPDLGGYVQRMRPTLTHTLQLFLSVTDAVQYAHQKGIIHRDLKPSNILVPTSEADPTNAANVLPKILDFGVARAMDADLRATTLLTEVGRLVGTLPYMSPEQIAGHSDEIDVRSDLYALGVILYELLAGHPPFVGDSTLETMRQIREDEPTSLRRFDREIPQDLEAICLRCLEKEPGSRYASALELAEDLRRFMRGDSVSARRLGKTARAWRWCRRRPLLAGMAATIVGLLAALSLGSAWFAWRESTLRQRAENETTRAEAVTAYLVRTFRSPDPWLQGKDVTVAQALDNAIEQLDDDWPQASPVKASLCDAFAQTLLSWGEYERSIELARCAHDMHQSLSGVRDEEALKAKLTLAKALRAGGQTREALELAADAHRELGTLQGPLAQESLEATITYAQALLDMSEMRKGLDLLQTTYEAAAESLGEFDPRTTQILAAWVGARETQGDVRSVTGLLKDLLQRARKERGETSKVVADLEAHLANNLRVAGDLEGSLELYEANLARVRGTLGDHHPQVALAINNLATVYTDLGRLEESLDLMVEVTERRRQRLGPDHRMTVFAMFNQGVALYNLARDQEAYDVLASALELSINNPSLGPQHVMTAQIRGKLGGVLWGLQRWDEAIQTLREARQEQVSIVGTQHPMTLETSWVLGMALNGAERFAEARDVLETTRAAMLEKFGPENPRTLNCSNSLVVTYRELGQLKQALALQGELTEISIGTLGPQHVSTLAYRVNHASLLAKNGLLSRAEGELRDMLAELESPADLAVVKAIKHRAQAELGGILIEAQQYEEAERWLLAAVEGLESLQGKHAGVDKPLRDARADLDRLYEAWNPTSQLDSR